MYGIRLKAIFVRGDNLTYLQYQSLHHSDHMTMYLLIVSIYIYLEVRQTYSF